MFKYDFYHWLRSKKIFILFIITTICSLTATLGSYYAKDIIDAVGTTGAEVIVKKMEWQDIMASYFKTSSQICLFTAIYIISTESQLGKGVSEKLFYQTRIKRGGKVLLSKVLVGFFINLISIFWSGLIAIYTVWALYSKIDLHECFMMIITQSLVFCIITVFGNTLSFYTSPFFSAVIIEIVVLFSGLLNNLKILKFWFPISLLSPEGIFKGDSLSDYYMKFLSTIIILIISIIFILFKPVKQRRHSIY